MLQIMFTATEREGVGAEQHDETTGAMIAQLNYGSGVPFYRLEKRQASLGIPLPRLRPRGRSPSKARRCSSPPGWS